MNGRTDRPDGEADLDRWLAAASGGLTSSIDRVLDVEAALTAVRRRAVVDLRSVRRKRGHPSRDAVPGVIAGTLALKLPPAAPEGRAKVVRISGGDVPDAAPADPRHGLEHYVERAVVGDRRAVEDLLREIRPLVLRYLRVRLESGDVTDVCADDLAQEVCLALLEALPGYHEQGRPFLAFVHGIAAREVASARRTAAGDPETPVPDVPDEAAVEDPGERVLRGEVVGRVAALLAVLPEERREIVLLRVVLGLSDEETAAAVGSTPGAVRVAQRRALAELRSAWGER